jgi:hypothetical protein
MYITQQTIENFPDGRKKDNVKLGIFKTDSHGVNKGH